MTDKSLPDEDSWSHMLVAARSGDRPPKSAKSCRVLVIEDSRADFDMIARQLRKASGVRFQVEQADRLAAGLDALAREGWDVALLDLNLPDSRGLDTLREFQRHVPEVPVVVLTGFDDESLAVEAVHEGAQDYVIKGQWQNALLIRSIRYAVARNRNRAKLARALQAAQAAEAKLRESEKRFRELFENSPDAVVVEDTEGKVLDVNPAACRLHGMDRKRLIGKHILELVPPDQREAAMRDLPKMASGELDRAEGYAQREAGDAIPVELKVSRIHDAGKPALLLHVRDITDRKRTERQLQTHREQLEELVAHRTRELTIANEELRREIANRHEAEQQLKASLREKDALLKEIHHRVKNNMQVISSLLNLQSRRAEDQRAREILRDTRSRVASMAMVHEQLYHAGDLAEVDFAAHVQNLAAYLFRAHGNAAQGIRFTADIDDVPLGLDTAIPCGLIVNELISNALKHAFVGRPSGTIGVGLHAEGDRLALSVFDDGVGLPESLDAHQAASMGWQVVRALVHQLGGILQVERHGGTRFQITFPRPDVA